MMFDFFVEETGPDKNKRISKEIPQKVQKRERMKRLHFTTAGVKKYKLILDAEMGVNNGVYSKTKVETSWILQVKNIVENGYLFDFIAYDQVLKECNSEGFEELFQTTKHFNKIYDEVTVITDLEGNLKKVVNANQLVEKWKNIKRETLHYFGTETNLEEYFAVNDETFSKPEFLKKLIGEAEFFFVYLHAGGYGQKFNACREYKRDNAFRTEQITWDLDFYGKEEIEPGSPFGKMKVESLFQPSKSWIQRAYGKFPFLNANELKPLFKIKGESVFSNTTGWITNSWLEVNEIVHPGLLFHKMKYTIHEIS